MNTNLTRIGNVFRIMCGKTPHKTQKAWYLGEDEKRALQAALTIREAWRRCKKNPGFWEGEALAVAEKARDEAQKPAPVTPASATAALVAPVPTASATLHATIDRLIKHFEADRSMRDSSRCSLITQLIRLKKYHKDLPLSSIDALAIQEMFNFWAALPTIRGETSKPAASIAPITAKHMITTLVRLFQSIDAIESYNWRLPRRFQEMAKRAKGQIDYSKAAPKTPPKLEEVALFYRYAGRRMKRYILLALNTGFTAIDISTLKQGMIKQEGDAWYIVRKRHKISRGEFVIETKWLLWDDTKKAIDDYQIREGKGYKLGAEELVFHTEAGRELVYTEGIRQIDAIQRQWRNLKKKMKRMGVKNVPSWTFRFLRKFGSQFMRSRGGAELAMTYSGQKDPTIQRFYSTPDFSKLDEALKDFRRSLDILFAP